LLGRIVVPEISGSAQVGEDGREEDRENDDRIDDRIPFDDGRRNTGMEILWIVPVLADLTSMALRSTMSGPLASRRCILAKYLSSPEAAADFFVFV
jgi:hypothetical protein